jgi:hypothetical protein
LPLTGVVLAASASHIIDILLPLIVVFAAVGVAGATSRE